MTISLVIIDDHHMVRAGVRAELEAMGADLRILGEASDVEGATGDSIAAEFERYLRDRGDEPG